VAGRIGIDFGTSNTVVAVWDPASEEARPLHFNDYGRRLDTVAGSHGANGGDSASIIPSLVHFAPEGSRWLGQQVIDRNLLADKERTFRLMKRYVANRSPVKKRIDGQSISHFDAGAAFIEAVLGLTAAELGAGDEEIAMTVPVDAYEHYDDWLTSVAETAGFPRVRLIDEPSAAALGYGANIQPGSVYLVFDFGGGTLDVAVVLIEVSETATLGRRCRVLGKAGTDIGGATFDTLLFQEVLKRNDKRDRDEDVQRVSGRLLADCEQAKIKLSFEREADISFMNPDTGAVLAATITRDEFEDLLDEHELLARMDGCIRKAIAAARERGYDEAAIHTVLMVGGSSQIPVVRKSVQRFFGKDRVRNDRPLDAVARGAAAFVAGVDFFDHIQHTYAIRHVDTNKGQYAFRELVAKGTPYPTEEPLAGMTIKASYDGQTKLGLAIFEIGESRDRGGVELVFDPSGAARLMEVSDAELSGRSHFWINEETPTFLTAEPPASQGEARFGVEFGIDANKRLLLTATDLRSKQTVLRDYPVVKLS